VMSEADVCNNGEQKEGEESPIGDAETPGSVVSGDFVVVGGMGGVVRPDIAGWGAEGSVKQAPSSSSDGKGAVSSAPNTAATSLGGLWRAALKDMGRSLLGMAGKRTLSSGEDRKDDDDDDHVLHPIPLLSLEEVVENARKGSLPQLVMLPDCLFPEGVFEVLSLVFGGRLSIVCIDPKTRASRERIEKTLRIHEGRSTRRHTDTQTPSQTSTPTQLINFNLDPNPNLKSRSRSNPNLHSALAAHYSKPLNPKPKILNLITPNIKPSTLNPQPQTLAAHYSKHQTPRRGNAAPTPYPMRTAPKT
jgi:hypothetical protein